MRKYAIAYGLNAKSGVDFRARTKGIYPTNAWEMKTYGVPMEPSEVCFLGIGQGLQATPLQMANIASAVINGGTLYKPEIVREIVSPTGAIVKTFSPEVIRQVPVTQESALRAVRKVWER